MPYIILYHSQSNLESEEERKSIIVDVQPLIGMNPIVPPEWNYHKIPVDLRQVPEQFIKSPVHEYIYLTYKEDNLFGINSRQVEIIKALNELE